MLDLFFYASAIGCGYVGGGVGTVFLCAMFITALFSPRMLMISFLSFFLLISLNGCFFKIPAGASLLKWLFLSFLFVVLHFNHLVSKRGSSKLYFRVLFFILAFALTALIGSYYTKLSLFKAFSTYLGYGVVVLMVHQYDIEMVKKRIIYFFFTIIFFSIPFLGLGAGFCVNGNLFQGIINHPQDFGVMLAGFLTFYFFHTVTKESDKSKVVSYLLCFLTLCLLLLARCRTGVFAIILTCGGLVFFAMFSKDLMRIIKPVLLNKLVLIGMVGLVLTTVIYSEQVYEMTAEIMSKGSYSEKRSLSESIVSSRQHLVANSIANFLENPVYGIGFGLPSDPRMLQVKQDAVLGIPLGAATEKGFFLTSILEETGVLGTIPFLMFLFYIFKTSYKKASATGMALLLVTIFINFGENTIFSAGGTGIYMMLFIVTAYYVAENEKSSPAH